MNAKNVFVVLVVMVVTVGSVFMTGCIKNAEEATADTSNTSTTNTSTTNTSSASNTTLTTIPSEYSVGKCALVKVNGHYGEDFGTRLRTTLNGPAKRVVIFLVSPTGSVSRPLDISEREMIANSKLIEPEMTRSGKPQPGRWMFVVKTIDPEKVVFRTPFDLPPTTIAQLPQ